MAHAEKPVSDLNIEALFCDRPTDITTFLKEKIGRADLQNLKLRSWILRQLSEKSEASSE